MKNNMIGLRLLDLAGRLYLGVTLIQNAPVGTYIPLESLGLSTDAFQFLDSLWRTSYLMFLVKAIELVSGVLLIVNRHVALATALVLPVLVGIVAITHRFFPGGLPSNLALLFVAVSLFLFRRQDIKYVEARLRIFGQNS